MEIFKATFERLVFYNAESEYFVGAVNTDEDDFCITGKVDRNDRFVPGLAYELSGKWVTHKTYGRQFAFDGFTQSVPLSRDEVVVYLTKYGVGIGVKISNDIYDKYRENSIVMIRSEPATVAGEVKRLTEKKAIETSVALKQLVGTEEVRARLMQIFAGRGVPSTVHDRCMDQWGVEAPTVITNRPYILLDAGIKRIGFKIADRMYLDFGGDPAADERTTRLLVYVLEISKTGSTWHPCSQVELEFTKSLTSSSAVFFDVVQRCCDAETVLCVDQYVCLWQDDMTENTVANDVHRLLSDAEVQPRKFKPKQVQHE